MFTWLKVWWLSQKISNAKREVEMFEMDMAVAAQNREIMKRRLARLEIQLIDLENV